MLTVQGFLTSEERLALRRVMYRSGHTAQEHVRANAILLLDKGWSIPQVAEAFFLDEQTVRNFLERYSAGKLDSLLNDSHHGRESKLTDSQKDQLRRHVMENLYMDSAFISAYVLDEFGISYSSSGTHALLHELGFVYKKPKHIPGKADPARQAEYAARIQDFLAMKSPDTRVYFMDAVHPQYNSTPSAGWILKGTDKELPANCGRQRLNLNGAIDVESHEAIVIDSPTIDADSVIELLQRLEQANPTTESIHVICDNAAYYHSRKVMDYLSASRISLDFLPPYSPNLNLIERLWKFFRKEVVNNHFYHSFAEFRERCLFFFECLSDHADRLKSLLTPNFQLFDQNSGKRVVNAY